MKKMARLPSVPLITHDPNFSIWSPVDHPAADNTVHWSDAPKQLIGMLVVDGTVYRYLGRNPKVAAMLTDCEITPLSTKYVFTAGGVQLTVRFTSPLLLDDLDILSTPISYVQYEVAFLDGKEHHVEVILHALGTVCCSGERVPTMRQDFFQAGALNVGYMGQMIQSPLKGSGDHMTNDSGYVFFATRKEDAEVDDPPEAYTRMLRCRKITDAPCSFTLMIGYDEVASINYFGRLLPGYWARNGKTITEALCEFAEREEEILARCEKFDRKLLRDARRVGGEDYAKIVTAAYRQTIAAHKLVADENGELLFISKEDDSNGCAATVDVSYPSVPLFLLYRPELVAAMCRPIFRFARMPIWHYDFAPHDVGRYPNAIGQIYAAHARMKFANEGYTYPPYYLYPSTVDAYKFETQMPVEESGNMLLMLAAVGYACGDWSLAKDNLDLLRGWCRYLLDYGEDPGDQLCTDDFTGHLAHNVNLSAKAVMGVAAYAMILDAVGEADEAKTIRAEAKKLADSWLRRADRKGGSPLSFDGTGWSQKYNLVWDKLFDLKLLPDDFYRREIASYLPKINRYGLPLDNRSSTTKSDWAMWVASLAENKLIFAAFAKPIARFLEESESRVPFGDLYDSVQGIDNKFVGRSVQGGVFMPLLMDKWRNKQ